jgi:hypothetical protein
MRATSRLNIFKGWFLSCLTMYVHPSLVHRLENKNQLAFHVFFYISDSL